MALISGGIGSARPQRLGQRLAFDTITHSQVPRPQLVARASIEYNGTGASPKSDRGRRRRQLKGAGTFDDAITTAGTGYRVQNLSPVDLSSPGIWPAALGPGTLEYALSQVQGCAADGTVWPPEQRALFEAAAGISGGFWVLTQCGEWREGRPLAGQPARVLTQLVFCLVEQQGGEGIPRKGRKLAPPAVTLVQQPVVEVPAGMAQVVLCAAHQLDENGWPTGSLFSSVTAVVLDSTRFKMKKADYAFNIIQPGAVCNKPSGRGYTLGTWMKRVMKCLPAVKRPDRGQGWHAQRHYHKLLTAAGVCVLAKPSAADAAQARFPKGF